MPSRSPPRRESLIHRVWYRDDLFARTMRSLLTPAEFAFSAAVRLRARRYDSGAAASGEPSIPTVSIGNLTVGGTGKTPIAAWVASELRRRGARPAIVLRGYGGDESLVHRSLNPDVPVFETPDRASGIRDAQTAGADLAVLDDAFQHRRVRRHTDIVLVSADRWSGSVRLLPAGPWREPIEALRRADLVIVIRKAVAQERVDALEEMLLRVAPAVARISIELAADALVRVGGPERLPLRSIKGRTVHLVAAIGDPRALIHQLTAAGAEVVAELFRDHHAFSDAEIRRLAQLAASGATPSGDPGSGGGLPDGPIVLCTLKDAVKIGDRWPREASPLWYVSQRVNLGRGAAEIERVLGALLQARHPKVPTTTR